ncbi:TERF1-interacting nuclear factor 2 isoform X2 [Engraulis encrasicolus]|uniref:TERF1-interacting nuclear factor 2 isoform X2 n=1 Tax=Engraulis encrasicolus TaxID=184585 RepID=UPI002FD07146
MDLEGVPLHSLCMLAPPLRVMSAAMWRVMVRRDVAQYGRVADFITSLWEDMPGLLAFRHYAKLALGLRSRLMLELCRGPEAPDSKVILAHLDRVLTLMKEATKKPRRDVKVEMAIRNFENLALFLLDNPAERELFFQEDFPEQYGPQFDKALEKTMWEFLTRLDQLLPVPDLAQTVEWLADTPVFLDDCAKPQLLKSLLQHEKSLGHTDSPACLLSTTGDAVLSSLSLPPSGRPLPETRQPGSGQTSSSSSSGRGTGATSGVRQSPARPRPRSWRQTGGPPIAPVIGSISMQDIESAVSGAQVVVVEEEKERKRESGRKLHSGSPVMPVTCTISPRDIQSAGAREEDEREEREGGRRTAPTGVTLQSDEEEEIGGAKAGCQTFTQIKPKSHSAKGASMASGVEETRPSPSPPPPPPVQTEDQLAVVTGTEAKQHRKRGRPKKAASLQGVEDAVREEAKPLKRRGRPRKSDALQGHELRNKSDERKKEVVGRRKSQRQAGGTPPQSVDDFTGVKLRENPERAALLRSCQKRQLEVVLPQLYSTEVTKSRKDGDGDSSVERDGYASPHRGVVDTHASLNGKDMDTSVSLERDNVVGVLDTSSLEDVVTAAIRACSSKRQLRVVLQRLEVSSPAIQTLLNPDPAAKAKAKMTSVSVEKGHVTVRKRKRRDSLSSPEKLSESSEDTENVKAHHLSQKTNCAGWSPASPGPSEDIVPDSEDEHPSNKLCFKRYYQTKHNTLVPTLEEFL